MSQQTHGLNDNTCIYMIVVKTRLYTHIYITKTESFPAHVYIYHQYKDNTGVLWHHMYVRGYIVVALNTWHISDSFLTHLYNCLSKDKTTHLKSTLHYHLFQSAWNGDEFTLFYDHGSDDENIVLVKKEKVLQRVIAAKGVQSV